MEARDRIANLGFFAAAAIAWILVGIVVTTLDPLEDPQAGYLGAGVMGAAMGLTTIPLFWLAVFGRHRQITYSGDWVRAIRRGGWVALIVVAFVVLRVERIFQVPIGVFIIAMVLVAETTLSSARR